MTIEELIDKIDKKEINIEDYEGYVYLTEFLYWKFIFSPYLS